MSEGTEKPLPTRERYTIQDLFDDLRLISPSPSVVYPVGSEIIYPEWNNCVQSLGENHPVTRGLAQILEFLEHGYEDQLVRGEIHRTSDTPSAVFKTLIKSIPPEALEYVITRPSSYVRTLLESVRSERKREIERYMNIEAGVRQEASSAPDDPDAQNKLRLLLWILGHYKEASEVFQKARRLGWDSSKSELVGL
ncbi:MAG: hypothetical protein QXQ81_09400 [Candidatus Thorarchaeota archaeon]